MQSEAATRPPGHGDIFSRKLSSKGVKWLITLPCMTPQRVLWNAEHYYLSESRALVSVTAQVFHPVQITGNSISLQVNHQFIVAD